MKKVTNTEITVFVYSNGKLVAEYSTQTPPPNPTTSYTMTDQLDSPRVITNALGEVTSRRDFMPFGEELPADINYRTASRKYGVSDNIRQKFTGYQKDTETNLDFAEARMYQNLHGRFTAVDPLLASGKSANPQTFNRYVYVMNNPAILTDPTGLQVGQDNGSCRQQSCPGANGTITRNGEGKATNIDFFAPLGKVRVESGFEQIPVFDTQISTTLEIEAFQNYSQEQNSWTYSIVGGMATGIANIPSNIGNFAIDMSYNSSIDLSGTERTGPSYYFPTVPYQNTTAAISGNISGLAFSAGLGSVGFLSKGNSVTSNSTTALSTLDDAYSASGQVRNIAGYEVAGNFGKVGNTYNANIWGMFGTNVGKTGKTSGNGLRPFFSSLEGEAVNSGASTLNIIGSHIMNRNFLSNPRMVERIARQNNFTFRRINNETILLSKPLK